MKNIFLIGMMGSWKSTVGRKLAKIIKMEFIDTDDSIEEFMDMKVSDIFYEFGEEKFREMEVAFFTEKSKQSGQIFSTGGGIILDPSNRKCLQNNGTTFFLNARSKTLAKRIHNTTKRPLLSNSINLQKKFDEIWISRKDYYFQSCDYIIDTDEMSPEGVVNEILNKIEFSIENN